MRTRAIGLAVVVAGVLGGGATAGAATSSGSASSDRAPAARSAATDPALRSAPADRIGRLADALRRSPLAVDPELDWMVDAAARRSLLRTLRGSDVPVLVAVLPLLTEDESGGDEDRVLRELQRRIGRDALYVVVDASGRIEESLKGVSRDLDVPFDLSYPPIERDRDESRPPDRFATVPGRLAELVRLLNAAEPSTSPAPGVVRVRDLSKLPSEYRDDEDDGGVPTAGLAVLVALVGGVLGLGIAFHRICRQDARDAREREEAAQRERERTGRRKRRPGGTKERRRRRKNR